MENELKRDLSALLLDLQRDVEAMEQGEPSAHKNVALARRLDQIVRDVETFERTPPVLTPEQREQSHAMMTAMERQIDAMDHRTLIDTIHAARRDRDLVKLAAIALLVPAGEAHGLASAPLTSYRATLQSIRHMDARRRTLVANGPDRNRRDRQARERLADERTRAREQADQERPRRIGDYAGTLAI